jgi:hypothetical protein
MFEISKYCRALPSLLDLKERGKGPSQFSEQVVGTVQLNDLYLLQGRETINTTTQAAPAVGANGFSTPFVVPPGEIWYVWEYAVSTTAGAGAAIDMQPSLLFDNTANLPVGPFVAAAATQAIRAGMDRTRWATPGTEFSFVVRSVTLAPTVIGAVVVTKLRL